MKKIYAILFSFILLSSCGPSIYKSQNLGSAVQKHKIVAIIPAEVTVKLRPREASRTTAEQLLELEQTTGYDIQDKMMGWFLRKSEKYSYTVKFQDVSKTNSLLKAAGIEYKDLKTTDRAKLAKILGVDAVMQDRLNTEKPISDGAAVAMMFVVGFAGTTNHVTTTININDGESGDILWKYDYAASGSIGSSTTRLVDALMRNATKKFPYSYH